MDRKTKWAKDKVVIFAHGFYTSRIFSPAASAFCIVLNEPEDG